MINKAGVYKIVNKINGNTYYGSTTSSFYNRWAGHRSELNRNTHQNTHLQNAWNYYGSDNFSFDIILLCDKNNSLYYEQLFLDKYWDGGINCYNMRKDARSPLIGRKGGAHPMLGKKHSPESRQKMSKSQKGHISWNKGIPASPEVKFRLRSYNLGKIMSNETKLKISNSEKGKIVPPETCEKISKIAIAQKRMPPSQLGKIRTEETLKKLSDSHKNKSWKLINGKRIWSNK